MLTLETIEAGLQRHLSRYNREQTTAICASGAKVLADLCEQRCPRSILDMGSGFSSWVFRKWAVSNATGLPAAAVVSTDHSSRWLKTTQIELENEGLDHELVLPQEMFERNENAFRPFDLVFVDIGPTHGRVAFADFIARFTADGGIVVLDDWQLDDYAIEMAAQLRHRGFEVNRLPEIDKFNRYMAAATRTPQ